MSETITIPLSKLAPWSGNVRRTGASDGIDELAASITAHGLLQSLVVREGKRGKYQIIAGQRRYLALHALLKSGTIAKDYPVPCMLASDTVDATELSLAENVIRAPMHPADQFEAFQALIEGGATATDVAARFGLSELAVTQRLKLGRLSPTILNAYRAGEIDLECAQAFTVTDDHEEQDRVYGQLTEWNRNARNIRRALTENEVATSEKRIRFIGLEAYQAAGGVIRQDLFCEEGTGYIVDVALLDRLVTEKLKALAAEVSAEGWHWVETAIEIDHQALSRFSRRYPDRVELPEDDQAELDALSEEYDTLVDSDDEETAERLQAIEARMDVLNAKTEAWTPDALAIAGAIVTLGYNGEIRIERGLIRKEDLPKAKQSAAEKSESADDTVATTSGLSERLIEELTAEKSAAIGAELATQPDIALAAVVHGLALDLLYTGYGSDTCLKLRITSPGLRSAIAKPNASKGLVALANEKDRLGDHLPGNPKDLWAWCLDAGRDQLLSLLAYIAGSAVDTVQRKGERADSGRLGHGNRLAEALKLDMTAWYAPTAETYFSRVQRGDILAAIGEAKGKHAPSLEKLKKAELAARAEAAVAGTGWLPKPLRIVSDAADTVEAEDIKIAAE